MLFAHFLDGPRGALLATGFRPPGESVPRRWLLIAPPLLEELNKSRRTLALLGRGLASRGVGVLLPDLYGTADSAGEIGDADWQTWVDDIACAHAWLMAQGAQRIDLLAMRGGALLAWEWLEQTATRIEQVILWHPVSNGKQLTSQLLRLRIAAGVMGRGAGETAAGLRAMLERDGAIEIAGYRLSATLLGAIERAALAPDLGGRDLGSLLWLQVVSSPDQGLPPAPARCTRAWSAAGTPSAVVALVEDAFWSTQEITEGERLVAATIARVLEEPDSIVDA